MRLDGYFQPIDRTLRYQEITMKKTLAILATAALAFSVTACGKDDKSSSQPEAETTTASDSFELDMPHFDNRAGINLTAEPMPEVGEIPSDWHEITNGKLTFKVPADVQMKEGGATIRSAKNADKTVNIMFFSDNDWSAEPETSTLYDSEAESAADDLGYPKDGDLTDEKTAKYMKDMGLDWDGSQLSTYKCLLSLTEADESDDKAEAFGYLATLKAVTFGMSFPKVRYLEADGVPVYFESYAGITFDPAKAAEDDEYRSLWVSAFVEPDLEYSAMIKANSQEEALQIASTIKINRN